MTCTVASMGEGHWGSMRQTSMPIWCSTGRPFREEVSRTHIRPSGVGASAESSAGAWVPRSNIEASDRNSGPGKTGALGRDEVVAKRGETEADGRGERQVSSRWGWRHEDTVRSLLIVQRGIVKGYSTEVLPTGSPESRKGGAKKAEERGENKSRGFSQIKAIRDKCAAKEKLAEDKIAEERTGQSPNIRLGKNHIRRIWTELRITRNVL